MKSRNKKLSLLYHDQKVDRLQNYLFYHLLLIHIISFIK